MVLYAQRTPIYRTSRCLTSTLLAGTGVCINVGTNKITRQLLRTKLAEEVICCLKSAIISHQVNGFHKPHQFTLPSWESGEAILSPIVLKHSNRKKVFTGQKETIPHLSGTTSIPSHRSVPARLLPLSSSAQSPTAEHYSSNLPLRPYRNGGMLF